MRLWHKELIHYLPRQQLLGQWRELNAMYKQLKTKGKVTHRMVSYLNYDLESFWKYSRLVMMEMFFREYKVTKSEFYYEILNRTSLKDDYTITFEEHNDDYLIQCIFNLEEKHDRGMINDKEWQEINKYFGNFIKNFGKKIAKIYLQNKKNMIL